MRKSSHREARKASERRQVQKTDSEREKQTAGKCRQGEISLKPLQQMAASAQYDPWLQQRAEQRLQTAWSEKGEREHWRSTAEKNNNHSVSVVPRMSTDCEMSLKNVFSLNFVLQIWTKKRGCEMLQRWRPKSANQYEIQLVSKQLSTMCNSGNGHTQTHKGFSVHLKQWCNSLVNLKGNTTQFMNLYVQFSKTVKSVFMSKRLSLLTTNRRSLHVRKQKTILHGQWMRHWLKWLIRFICETF